MWLAQSSLAVSPGAAGVAGCASNKKIKENRDNNDDDDERRRSPAKTLHLSLSLSPPPVCARGGWWGWMWGVALSDKFKHLLISSRAPPPPPTATDLNRWLINNFFLSQPSFAASGTAALGPMMVVGARSTRRWMAMADMDMLLASAGMMDEG